MADEQPISPLPTITVAQAETHDEMTRRWIVKALVYQWAFISTLIMGALLFRGWELAPSAQNVFFIILTTDATAFGIAYGFYLSTSLGSVQKGKMLGEKP